MENINHLINETSPYLLQHATNPVYWYGWHPTVLQKAVQDNKPILLSIGYSACHWCHVMAHESFEDKETTDLMNQFFINIKVDREERPDIDKIYQTLHSTLTHQPGGWPLTVFLMPGDLSPIFSGTYFPKEARYHLPSFKEVLVHIHNLYVSQPGHLKERTAKIIHYFNRPEESKDKSIHFNKEIVATAVNSLMSIIDKNNGGFGSAPKFPQPSKLEFLLHESSNSIYMTFKKMAEGGLYDQLGGGFFRYTVDESWRIPHFEKMLYDNAQLLYLFTLAAGRYIEKYFESIAVETAEWLINEMQMTEGGFYSSLDADSKEGEGAYYIWDKKEVTECLEKEELAVVSLYYGLDQPAYFHHRWHFYIAQLPSTINYNLQLSLAKVEEIISLAKRKLLIKRKQRSQPSCDRKILTAWNSLAIKALVVAAAQFNKPSYLKSALKALGFIKTHLFTEERLRVSYHMKTSPLIGYLDDYAYLLDAMLTLLQYQWDIEYLNFAMKLADQLLHYFYDEAHGGFYFTAVDQDRIIYRPKVFTDEVTPTGNGTAINALLILGYLLAENKYLLAAENSLKVAWPGISSYPMDHCHLLSAFKKFIDPPYLIIFRGKEDKMKEWSTRCRLVNPQAILFSIPEKTPDLPSLLKEKSAKGEIVAYLCKGTQCTASTDQLEDLLRAVSN